MSYFDDAFEYLIKQEGELATNPHDHGGITKFGITIQTLNDFRGTHSAVAQDIQSLTQEQAKAIYHALYWGPLGLDKCEAKAMCVAIFDQAVNRGCGTAAGDAQTALNSLGFPVAIDRVIGYKTVDALNRVDARPFIDAFFKITLKAYVRIVKNDNTQIVFLDGWINRACSLLDLA